MAVFYNLNGYLFYRTATLYDIALEILERYHAISAWFTCAYADNWPDLAIATTNLGAVALADL
ncbi:hypothetical protein Plhal304r1_c016g0058651 [Plasmopara halstedii]